MEASIFSIQPVSLLGIVRNTNKTYYREEDLNKLSHPERITLGCIIILVSTMALLANFIAIIAIIKRKQRPLFRACLISLALSDILYVTFTSTYYMAQFIAPYTSIWVLGDALCRLIPAIQSLSILANSFTLVTVAFDRYICVTNMIKAKWQPELMASTIICIFIWLFATGIACGALWNYKNIIVTVVIMDPDEPTQVIDSFDTYICLSEKVVNRKYYSMIFGYVFIPATLVFVWLNVIIAKQIWDRRRPFHTKQTVFGKKKLALSTGDLKIRSSDTSVTSLDGNYRQVQTISATLQSTPTTENCQSSGHCTFSATSPDFCNNTNQKCQKKSPREIKHLRMFKAVIWIIVLFLVCRLPQWIFLLYKIYNDSVKGYWMLHYSLGILILVNCLTNPFMYGFLSTTIQMGEKFTNGIKYCFRPCTGCCCRTKIKPNEAAITENEGSDQYKKNILNTD